MQADFTINTRAGAPRCRSRQQPAEPDAHHQHGQATSCVVHCMQYLLQTCIDHTSRRSTTAIHISNLQAQMRTNSMTSNKHGHGPRKPCYSANQQHQVSQSRGALPSKQTPSFTPPPALCD
eukprot:GHRQ01018519.1.p2 GENE.GHRQ01018519.1~~GHRQ01018519.1.p2  ORF type:complete len:121 (-),score=15.27 GHRQ01018519.1:154-516(-)